MKKIACLIKNINFYRNLKEVAEREGFVVENVDKNFDIDYSHLMLVTDSPALAMTYSNYDIPVALVGNDINTRNVHILNDPFDNIQFKALVDFVFHGCSNAFYNKYFRPAFVEKKYFIDNDIFKIDKIVYCITKELIFFCSISDIQKIRIGLSEMLTNAIEHGNLEISAEEKFKYTEKGTYVEFVKEKIDHDKYRNRKVSLEMSINESEVRFVITDEGKGFNLKETKFETEGDDLLKLHGRGILITKMYFDSVEYNDKGNSVELRKSLKC
jgi:anti-sigma regulatory factor (Ser/Thr protein kinase)